jgi:hypothetical protein
MMAYCVANNRLRGRPRHVEPTEAGVMNEADQTEIGYRPGRCTTKGC